MFSNERLARALDSILHEVFDTPAGYSARIVEDHTLTSLETMKVLSWTSVFEEWLIDNTQSCGRQRALTRQTASEVKNCIATKKNQVLHSVQPKAQQASGAGMISDQLEHRNAEISKDLSRSGQHRSGQHREAHSRSFGERFREVAVEDDLIARLWPHLNAQSPESDKNAAEWRSRQMLLQARDALLQVMDKSQTVKSSNLTSESTEAAWQNRNSWLHEDTADQLTTNLTKQEDLMSMPQGSDSSTEKHGNSPHVHWLADSYSEVLEATHHNHMPVQSNCEGTSQMPISLLERLEQLSESMEKKDST